MLKYIIVEVDMGALDNHFSIDLKDAITDPRRIFIGNRFRISVISDVLIRFEYN